MVRRPPSRYCAQSRYEFARRFHSAALTFTNTLGSVQNIASIPNELKDIYRTAWELEPFAIIDMAVDRAPYVEQSQSLTLHIGVPTVPLLVCQISSLITTAMIILTFHQKRLQTRAWDKGLKTGVYYLRTKSPACPLYYGIDPPHELQSDHDSDSDLPPPLEEIGAVVHDSNVTDCGTKDSNLPDGVIQACDPQTSNQTEVRDEPIDGDAGKAMDTNPSSEPEPTPSTCTNTERSVILYRPPFAHGVHGDCQVNRSGMESTASSEDSTDDDDIPELVCVDGDITDIPATVGPATNVFKTDEGTFITFRKYHPASRPASSHHSDDDDDMPALEPACAEGGDGAQCCGA